MYMAPGVQHCTGGSGADSIDLVTTLANWVERNDVPGSHTNPALAWKRASPSSPADISGASFSRPLCAYPEYSHYIGRGDVNLASSYVCRPGLRERQDD